MFLCNGGTINLLDDDGDDDYIVAMGDTKASCTTLHCGDKLVFI